jgi:hypothetical protein
MQFSNWKKTSVMEIYERKAVQKIMSLTIRTRACPKFSLMRLKFEKLKIWKIKNFKEIKFEKKLWMNCFTYIDKTQGKSAWKVVLQKVVTKMHYNADVLKIWERSCKNGQTEQYDRPMISIVCRSTKNDLWIKMTSTQVPIDRDGFVSNLYT